jgi:hypothetical protein
MLLQVAACCRVLFERVRELTMTESELTYLGISSTIRRPAQISPATHKSYLCLSNVAKLDQGLNTHSFVDAVDETGVNGSTIGT